MLIISCHEKDLKQKIEDTLGVISATKIDEFGWEIIGFDEVLPNCDVVFNERDRVVISVFPAEDYSILEDFFSEGVFVDDMTQQYWFSIR